MTKAVAIRGGLEPWRGDVKKTSVAAAATRSPTTASSRRRHLILAAVASRGYARNSSGAEARFLEPDARTRTGDPFTTSACRRQRWPLAALRDHVTGPAGGALL